jgi:TatD DNase family protein
MLGDWLMLLDTHCHLDASEFALDREAVIARALAAGVQGILIPAVDPSNFEIVRALAHSVTGGAYALGVHPMYVQHVEDQALVQLRHALEARRDDPHLVAVGEIGLDFFVPEISQGEARAKQERFYVAQLKLAIEFDLPVILHVRRSQDVLLKYLRRHPVRGGLAHAFNGSVQQAQQFIDAGFALGFGGAMTYARALQIRRLACALPLESIVLETDAPDIAPAWLTETRRNEPAEVRRIAHALAELRGISYEEVLIKTAQAARSACPTLDLALRS